MDIVKINKFIFSKKGVEKFRLQSKNFDHENRRLEQKVEILKDPDDVCDCLIAFYSFSISKEKIGYLSSSKSVSKEG